MARGYSPAWLATAIAVSTAVVFSAPFVGQLRSALHQQLGNQFIVLMAVVVGGVAAAALLFALVHIRERRAARYGAVAAAVLIATGYAWVSSTGNADVDAVERFHFIEYGLITALFYNAWRPSADGGALMIPLLAGLLVGMAEEWLQWFIPVRIGELRDVVLNLFAIGTGLLFCLGLEPPARLTLAMSPRSRRRAATLAAAAILALAAFIHSVHLGHEIADREAGVFRSRYTAQQLAEISAARERRWKTNPPLTWSRLSREDQYFSEALAHVRRRNQAWAAGNLLAAWHENLILENYYAPVLDTPSYVSATGHRWPEAQRAEAEAQPGPGFMIYDSDALPYPVFTWPAWVMWLVVAGVVAGLLRRLPGRT